MSSEQPPLNLETKVIGDYHGQIVSLKNAEFLAISPIIKLPEGEKLSLPILDHLPKVLTNKNKEVIPFMEKRSGLLFTTQQRDAIYEAIEKDKNLVKIRRLQKSTPLQSIPKPRTITDATELEKKLNLEFSIIIDNNREAIALFPGKEFKVAAGKEETTKLKFGQRLSDGKWVFVKIYKSDLAYKLADLKAQLETLKLQLKELEHLHVSSNLSEQIKSLTENIEITARQLSAENELKQIGQKITSAVDQGLGVSERTKNDKIVSYEIQVLMEGFDVSTYIDSTSENYISDPKEVLNMGLSFFQEMESLHDKNIIHADIKPENMIYLQDEKPPKIKMVDYEHAMILNPGQVFVYSEQFRGTPDFNAPESLLKREYSFASDVYSMALVLEDMRFKQFLDPSLTKEFDALIISMKNINPRERISSAAASVKLKNIVNTNIALIDSASSLYLKVCSLANNMPALENMLNLKQLDKNTMLFYLLKGRKQNAAIEIIKKYGIDLQVKDLEGKDVLLHIFENDLFTVLVFLDEKYNKDIMAFLANKDNFKALIKNADDRVRIIAKLSSLFKQSLDRLNVSYPRLNMIDILTEIAKDDPKFIVEHYGMIKTILGEKSLDKIEHETLVRAKAEKIHINLSFIQLANPAIIRKEPLSTFNESKLTEEFINLSEDKYYAVLANVIKNNNANDERGGFDHIVMNSLSAYIEHNKHNQNKLFKKFLLNGDKEPLLRLLVSGQIKLFTDYLAQLSKESDETFLEFKLAPKFISELLEQDFSIKANLLKAILQMLENEPVNRLSNNSLGLISMFAIKKEDFRTLFLNDTAFVAKNFATFSASLESLGNETYIEFIIENLDLMINNFEENERKILIEKIFKLGLHEVIVILINEDKLGNFESDIDIIEKLLDENPEIMEPLMDRLLLNESAANFFIKQGIFNIKTPEECIVLFKDDRQQFKDYMIKYLPHYQKGEIFSFFKRIAEDQNAEIFKTMLDNHYIQADELIQNIPVKKFDQIIPHLQKIAPEFIQENIELIKEHFAKYKDLDKFLNSISSNTTSSMESPKFDELKTTSEDNIGDKIQQLTTELADVLSGKPNVKNITMPNNDDESHLKTNGLMTAFDKSKDVKQNEQDKGVESPKSKI